MNTISKILAGLGAYLLATLPATAANISIGQSLSSSCFDEATWGSSNLQALEVCNRAIDEELLITKDLAATYVNRGIVKANRGDIEGALDDYETALKIKPNLGDALANMGSAYLYAERYEDALGKLAQALSYDNLAKPSHVYFNIAIAQEGLGNTKEAYLNFKKAAELNPKWPWPRDELKRFTVSAQQ
ncbi:MAG: hypothetical protein COA85_02705 [Robiginitomaculum sp.]|nr:MAG: hypothetical protein COA85_02705 [Robiginitomaculum sp.]